MSGEIFGAAYAGQYDSIYSEKDYEAEADLLVAGFHKHAIAPVKRIIDLGCGTGRHAMALARRGYAVHGVERSPEMLTVARQRAAAEAQKSATFSRGDLRTYRAGQQCDAALMMFAVLGYQTSNDDVMAALATARAALRPGGLFMADVWYGPAVLAQRPGTSLKVFPTAGGKIIRSSTGKLDAFAQCVSIDIHTWELEADRILTETTETHVMRFFFAQELRQFLRDAGMHMVSLTTWPSLDRVPSETDWNVLVIARACERK